MRRSIICFFIIASLILCSTSVAFANPLDPWTSVQADRVTNGVVSIDNTLSNVYTALSALYNYLKNNGDGVVEGLLVLANRVSNIISTIDYYLPNINTNLQNIYSSLAAHSGSNLDLWGLTNSILTNTNALATGQLGIAQDVYNISGYTNSIQSKLTTLNQTEISSLAKLTNIDNNIDQVESQLSDINYNILNKYQWRTLDTTYNGISTTNSNYGFTNLSNVSEVYSNITFTSRSNNQPTIYVIKVPSGLVDSRSLDSININNSNVDLKILHIDYGFRYTSIYVYADYLSTSINNFTIKYTFKDTSNYSQVRVYQGSESYVKYLLSSDPNFYDFLDHLAIMSIESKSDSSLNDIKNILIDIDNNSDFIQNNNDLQINVDIDAADGQGITAIILKLQDIFDFGVGLQEFLVTLNEFDNLHWFTRLETYEQVNYDPRTNLGYQDLYD